MTSSIVFGVIIVGIIVGATIVLWRRQRAARRLAERHAGDAAHANDLANAENSARFGEAGGSSMAARNQSGF